jgi:fructose-specific phosphotransferase system IIA component
MTLTEILSPSGIKVPLASSDKEGIIRELVEVLSENGNVSDREAVVRAVLRRERTRTTGIGRGVAIPHGRCAEVKSMVMAVGTLPGGVDFDSVDGGRVHLVVLLISPASQTGLHIQALARISRIMADETFCRRLTAAGTPEEIYAAIQQREGTAD